MAEIIRMPKLSDTMTEGVLVKWLKKVGDPVKTGELLAEIETDKATMEFESFFNGILLYTGIKEGQGAPVDAIIAVIGEKDEKIDELLSKAQRPDAASKTVETKKEEKTLSKVDASKIELKSVTASTPGETTHTSSSVISQSSNITDGKLKASPLAKKIAKDKNINISMIKGSGDDGRIIKRDIENYSGTVSALPFVGKESFEEIPVSLMRKTIARRLSESKFTSPHFYLTIEINMDKAIDARTSINEFAPFKISFNDLIIKAAAHSLRQNLKVNSSWRGDKIVYNKHIHIGVAIAMEEGLVVPVLRFADNLTLTQISTQVKSFAEKAKVKKLQPQEMEGNTFTISNLGMFGIEEFTAIINPPDACIMAVGGIKQVPILKNGNIVAGNVMKVTLSCDHRAVDGAIGAAFLQTFKNLLENPYQFLALQSV